MQICIKDIVKDSFCNVWRHRVDWLKLAAAPLLIWVTSLLFLIIVSVILETEVIKETANVILNPLYLKTLHPFAAIGLLVYLLGTLIASNTFTINGYRYLVYGDYAKSWLTFQWNKRLVKLIIYYLGLAALTILYLASLLGLLMVSAMDNQFVLIMILGIVAVFGSPFLFLYISLRISLYSLVISADYDHPLRTSWKLLKGHLLKLLAILICMAVGGALISFMLALPLYGISYFLVEGSYFERLLAAHLSGLLGYIFSAFSMQAYAYVFKAVKGKK